MGECEIRGTGLAHNLRRLRPWILVSNIVLFTRYYSYNI